MKNKTRVIPGFIALLCTAVFAQQTDPTATSPSEGEIIIPAGSQGAHQDSVEVPAKGLKQAQVLDRFGEPERRSPAKGEPPISRWWYPQFVVYFEGDTVIHSVRVFHRTQ